MVAKSGNIAPSTKPGIERRRWATVAWPKKFTAGPRTTSLARWPRANKGAMRHGPSHAFRTEPCRALRRIRRPHARGSAAHVRLRRIHLVARAVHRAVGPQSSGHARGILDRVDPARR